MKKIVILAHALTRGGGINILLDFLKNEKILLKQFKFYIILSSKLIPFDNDYNLIIISYPKKSLIHRVIFDSIILPKFINKNFDLIISFQNIIIPFLSIPSILYLHQAIPFSKLPFHFYTNSSIFFYKYFYKFLIIFSLNKASKIIVQSNWLKNTLITSLTINHYKIEVIKPIIKLKKFNNKDEVHPLTFIYPSSHYKYKNHRLILGALRLIDSEVLKKLHFIFTVSGNESKSIFYFKKRIEQITNNVKFTDFIDHDSLQSLISKSVLLFPSVIESYGLPIHEAKNHNSYILASNLPYVEEILLNYEKKILFNPFDSRSLANAIIYYFNIITKTIYNHPKNKSDLVSFEKKSIQDDSYDKIIKELI